MDELQLFPSPVFNYAVRLELDGTWTLRSSRSRDSASDVTRWETDEYTGLSLGECCDVICGTLFSI